jgi:rare lipoprotein A
MAPHEDSRSPVLVKVPLSGLLLAAAMTFVPAHAQTQDAAQAAEAAAASSSAPAASPAESASSPSAPAEIARGKATWYGLKFHGRRTSSGERFDMNKLTAAHEWLPLGTLVRVRNLANGREVVVRINDRAPPLRDRIIDLSKAAAAALGFVRSGKAQVVLLEH